MGYYREQLQKFKQTDFKHWELLCADEVDIRCPDLPDEQFENLVDFVYDWVMNSEILPAELMGYIATGLADKEFTLDDFGTFEGQCKITDVINGMI